MNSWFLELLKCPTCNGKITYDNDRLECAFCSFVYPCTNNVPFIFKKDEYINFANILAEQLGIKNTDAVVNALSSSLEYIHLDQSIAVESSNILDRYPALVNYYNKSANGSLANELFFCECEYFNNLFNPGQSSYRTFRIYNNSNEELESTGLNPYYISYKITSNDGIVTYGPRSKFPINLLPGKSLSVPLLIEAPINHGEYTIVVLVVKEYVKWYNESPIYTGVFKVGSYRLDNPPEVIPHLGYFDFDSDLKACKSIYFSAIEILRYSQGSKNLNICEVACGSDPQTLRHYMQGTKVVATDISYTQTQLASLSIRDQSQINSTNYSFIASQVLELPFFDNSFDCIVISAALHHFTDITMVLRYLSRILKDTGLLVIMREPCKVCPYDEKYIEELKNGFNEQQFEIEEYYTMFERSGYEVLKHRIDFDCSYKAILKKAV
jgi:ubiquinone/menaquinone biosynthesis C-methylase UbiE/uncharacterized protein YbaR (Trm112 family)